MFSVYACKVTAKLLILRMIVQIFSADLIFFNIMFIQLNYDIKFKMLCTIAYISQKFVQCSVFQPFLVVESLYLQRFAAVWCGGYRCLFEERFISAFFFCLALDVMMFFLWTGV